MNFLIVLIVSLLLLFVFRGLFILLQYLLCRMFKSVEKIGFQLSMSLFFLLIYLQVLIGAVQGVVKAGKINSNLEWYLIYTLIGIASILWCYFSWELEWKAKPKFGVDGLQITIKKIIVFTCVMAFTFYLGYEQINKHFSGQEVDLSLTISNATIIPGIIALDRVLNQIKTYKEQKKKDKR